MAGQHLTHSTQCNCQEVEDGPATLAVPLIFAPAPQASKERKNGALVLCCTDISMPYGYLSIRYTI